MWTKNLLQTNYSKGENVCSHKDLHLDVYSMFIHNGKKVGTIQLSTNW